MTKLATYFEALALEALLQSKGIHMKGINLGTIIALLTVLAPIIEKGGPALDEAIAALNAALPILEQAGIVPAGLATILAQLVTDYAGYVAGNAVTVGPFEVALLGTKDQVSLVVKKG